MSVPVRRGGKGFSDSIGLDFTDPESGACGLVLVEMRPAARRAAAVALLLDGDETTEVARSEVELDPPESWDSVELDGVRVADDGERVRAALRGDGAGLEAEVTRLGGVAFEAGSAFAERSGLAHEAFSARVSAEWRTGGSHRRVRSVGRLVRTSGRIDWDRIDMVRSLTATLEDGSLLAVASARPRGAAGHDEEAVSAVLLDTEGSVRRFEEPLLSTEYDAAGRHRRAGVELWESEQAAALRGAGTRIGAAAVELGGVHVESTFLRFTLSGASGTARYDLLRAA